MTLRERYEARRKQWEKFNRWEAEQTPIERDPSAIMEDVGAIWEWLPLEDRLHDQDPEKLGIQALRAARQAKGSRKNNCAAAVCGTGILACVSTSAKSHRQVPRAPLCHMIYHAYGCKM